MPCPPLHRRSPPSSTLDSETMKLPIFAFSGKENAGSRFAPCARVSRHHVKSTCCHCCCIALHCMEFIVNVVGWGMSVTNFARMRQDIGVNGRPGQAPFGNSPFVAMFETDVLLQFSTTVVGGSGERRKRCFVPWRAEHVQRTLAGHPSLDTPCQLSPLGAPLWVPALLVQGSLLS